ncbi:nitroimidazol reductase NimA-like FMN-containing flavoprotein (pyridoxamine 5'-phosphate oxidase superfamily) [Alkalihalobacillus xiaoxiensis]|uniref:Nitroimidazol reductase NimA-like FMN-containing flavoprotein (Pyridoxamine 5'-phosphate oxidase superfamily) n=1 Tax=Shouchella xiaoxiensis TaxID=766895 RepID=A0ABS2SPQ9_9BACI|nr:pyridoxamine 5'-phosphate oxidase family protein [Shouchella xiaoxiensis]MBM7837230.1 nitroimidazol reductase NimA-like FMN-containing flavoprotein (pyridoxamine 5'-phosphate oxidase superfamily) [Shouchella xiaoxiensis]
MAEKEKIHPNTLEVIQIKIVDENQQSRKLLNQVLSRPLFAHLSTVENGAPRDSPIWFLWEEDALWFIGNLHSDSFPTRVKNNPHCAVGIVDYDQTTGLVHHVGFRGQGQLLPPDSSRAKRLFTRYMGSEEQWNQRFTAVLTNPDWIWIKMIPETVVIRDQSYSRPSSSL